MTFFLRVLAAQIILTWNPNTDSITGYKLHYGTTPRTYQQHLVVGNATSVILNNLAPGTYYAAVTAYNSLQVESAYSNEIAFTVSAPVLIVGQIKSCLSGQPLPGVTVTLSGQVSASTVTDQNGNYSFSVPSGTSYTLSASQTPISPGSPAINTIDVLVVNNYYLGQGILICPAAAEANGTPPVNIMDVVAIQKFTVGIASGKVGQWQFTPIPPTLDFSGVLIGDVQ